MGPAPSGRRVGVRGNQIEKILPCPCGRHANFFGWLISRFIEVVDLFRAGSRVFRLGSVCKRALDEGPGHSGG